MKRKGAKVFVKSLISIEDPSFDITEPADETKPQEDALNMNLSPNKETDYDILKRKFQELQSENLALKKKIENHEHEQKQLQQHITDLEKQLNKAGIDLEDKVKIAFKDFLTSNQIEILLKKKKKARWTQQELSKAFTLR